MTAENVDPIAVLQHEANTAYYNLLAFNDRGALPTIRALTGEVEAGTQGNARVIEAFTQLRADQPLLANCWTNEFPPPTQTRRHDASHH